METPFLFLVHPLSLTSRVSIHLFIHFIPFCTYISRRSGTDSPIEDEAEQKCFETTNILLNAIQGEETDLYSLPFLVGKEHALCTT